MTPPILTAPRTEPLQKCPVCDRSDTKHFFSAPDRLHGVPGEFSYDLCSACGSVFQNPMVVSDDLGLCYPTEYSPYTLVREVPDVDFDRLPQANMKQRLRREVVEAVKGNSKSDLAGRLGTFLSRSKRIRERAFYGLVIDECLPKGRGPHCALDLGCGSGWFMQKLQKVGWTVEGLEWNQEAAEKAQDITGCKVYAGDFRGIDLPKGKYDLIVLNHVIEHLTDPLVALRRLHELLKDGGKVVLFYPNPNSLGSTYFGNFWFAWDPPRHLIFPSASGLRLLSERAGFRECKIDARAAYTEVQWGLSKAYQNGLSADQNVPLGVPERVGTYLEKTLAASGVNKGWEIVAELNK
jgi:SAM-dependent methyltransferase